MKFTVYRKNWIRGNGVNSSLLAEDGKRCCLGFLASYCGYKDSELLNKSCLEDLSSLDRFIRLPKELVIETSSDYFQDSAITKELMEANDDPGWLTDSGREKQLTELFATLNIEVEFV